MPKTKEGKNIPIILNANRMTIIIANARFIVGIVSNFIPYS